MFHKTSPQLQPNLSKISLTKVCSNKRPFHSQEGISKTKNKYFSVVTFENIILEPLDFVQGLNINIL